MKFTTTTALASTLALASALACPNPQAGAAAACPKIVGGGNGVDNPDCVKVFRLFALVSSQNYTVSYTNKGLGINTKQDAKCRDPSVDYVSLSIAPKDASYQPGGLFLYSGNPPIQAYVDRSGPSTAPGPLKFTQGVQPLPDNAVRGPWTITKDLTLFFGSGDKTAGFQACTTDNGKTYSVGVQGDNYVGGYATCTPFSMQVWPLDTSEAENPNQCTYDF